MANVFLSYDHEDVAFARPIAAALEKAGHAVWYDRHIHGGAQYSRKIEQALDAADAVIVLWSPRSLESAWVRDEAAEGRDRGKLVPLSIGGVSAPMGFRQFQTIDLGSWKGRGKVPRLGELLQAVDSQGQQAVPTARAPQAPPETAIQRSPRARQVVIAAIALLAALGVGAWLLLGRSGLPIVEVAAADRSLRSQAAASDLFVKLGSLAQIGEGKWQLVDASSTPGKRDYVFRTADTSSAGKPRANLVLLDGHDDSLLWSREFSFPAGGEADLRQQLSFTAGRVLGCALESREAGGVPRDLLKLFLNTCATLAETSASEPEKSLRPLRTIVTARPRFTPAWGRLIMLDTNLVDMAGYGGGDPAGALRQLRSDMEMARRAAPNLPELVFGELKFVPYTAYERRLQLLARAIQQAPHKAELFTDQAFALQTVGRMAEAIASARRSAELDPLSPAATTNLIMTLAYGGQLDEARQELARAERLWAGTGALRDAQWGFHLRFGDPETARTLAGFSDPSLTLYLDARADPSPEKIAKLTARINNYRGPVDGGGLAFWLQALAEFDQTDDLLRWIGRGSPESLAEGAYVLFRPAFANFRRDPRFMGVAKRIGLLDYWRSTGKWPDFCTAPDLPYDCKVEVAKYA